jgi:diaminohydroxyphosphoribosylaminopyrimidine deaminase/5-amino-6-(5-phosphoribosylamino)uracil reductase
MKNLQADIDWMNLALKLAQKGRGWASPNPMVGACLVNGKRLIASGFHARFGGPHAEAEVIRKVGRKAQGATLYVTLEPCSTYGKTPPCTDAILSAGIKRVVVAAIDLNPKHHGRGIKILKKRGVSVTAGVLERKAREQNRAFFKWIQKKIPYVILKMAQSLDGKIASRTGKSRWISGPKARAWVHGLRASVDAVLIGKNTAILDDPRLTVRNGKLRREPWRVVLDPKGEIPRNARLFRANGPVILACSRVSFKAVLRKFNHRPVTILPLNGKKGKLDLGELLKSLGSLGITSLLVEGGGETAWSFLNARLVDKIAWVIAPKLVGGKDSKTSVEGLGVDSLNEAPRIKIQRSISLGDDLLIEGYIQP